MLLSEHAKQALERAERAYHAWMKAEDTHSSIRSMNRAEEAFNATTQALFYVIRTDQRTDATVGKRHDSKPVNDQ